MKKYKINKGIIVKKTGDSISIFDSEQSVVLSFNKSATFVFNKIKAGWSDEKVISQMMNRYEITTEVAKKDFYEFISELVKRNIIEEQ